MEDGQEAARDEIEDPPLVGREALNLVLDVGGDDRVVVVDAGVVHDPAERKLVGPEHEAGGRRILADRLQRGGGRLQLRDEVAGKKARGSTRVRDRLLVLVQGLGCLQRAARGEPEAPVRSAPTIYDV